MRHRRVPRRHARRDDGFALVFVGIVMVALLVVAAIVIDIAFLRDDRAADQRITDSAASAGAMALMAGGGTAACDAAFDYLSVNLPSASSLSTTSCSTFSGACDPTTDEVVTRTLGRYTVRFVYPVSGANALMARTSAVGAPGVSSTAADGTRCERVGVELSLTRGPSFGSIVGSGDKTTKVHTVALGRSRSGSTRPIAMVVLERTRCGAVTLSGGGSLLLKAVVDGGATFPGVLAADSDGTVDCAGDRRSTAAVISQEGSGMLRVDGPPGCAGDTGGGAGCGEIYVRAASADGASCRPTACSGSAANVKPFPRRLTEPVTRASIDHTFDCKASYAAETWYATQPINGCTGPGRSYVTQLRTFAGAGGAPPTFSVYGDSKTEPCDAPPATIPVGNWFVLCNKFEVRAPVTFLGGNVIFGGDVELFSQGTLTLHACGAEEVVTGCPGASLPSGWTSGSSYDPRHYSADAAWAWFRGRFIKTGGANVVLNDTTAFIGATGTFELSGHSDRFVWQAPRRGPFRNLALWSESAGIHQLKGGSAFDAEGVFFIPLATLHLEGAPGQAAYEAQFVVRTLNVIGSAALEVAPSSARTVSIMSPRSVLIR